MDWINREIKRESLQKIIIKIIQMKLVNLVMMIMMNRVVVMDKEARVKSQLRLALVSIMIKIDWKRD